MAGDTRMVSSGKLAVYDAPGRPFELRSYPIRPPRRDEALVRVRMSTICRSDIHSYLGHRPNPCPGVLGHEIAHIVKKHHLKVLQKQQLLNLGAGLLGEKYAKDNQTVEKVIGSGAEIMARGLDKNAEYEADRMGLVLAARAGYEPYGLPEVLQAISETNPQDNSVALLFKTHPHPDDRLARLAEATGSKLDKISGKTLPERFYRLKD